MMSSSAEPVSIANLDSTYNFRNLSGLRAADGLKIAGNVLYRSAALNRLSASDWSKMDCADVATIVDLRGEQEYAQAPTQVPPGHCSTVLELDIRNDVRSDLDLISGLSEDPCPDSARQIMVSIYRRFPGVFATRLPAIFAAALERRVPLLIHCTAGKDRTGFAIAMILHVLGVNRDDIMADYLASSTNLGIADRRISGLIDSFRLHTGIEFSPSVIVPFLDVEEGYLHSAFATIDADYGGIDCYLERTCGLTLEQRKTLQATMLL